MFLRPRVQLKPIECDALNANRYLGEARPHLGVEAIAIHAEIAGCIPEPEQAGKNLHG
jgi:hypothetical protein